MVIYGDTECAILDPNKPFLSTELATERYRKAFRKTLQVNVKNSQIQLLITLQR